MFGSQMLDVGIGLVFVYLILSLAVTAASELIAAWFRSRAWVLRRGINILLGDEKMTQELYDHALIRSLSPKGSGKNKRGGPSYIPSRTFAIALLDTVPRKEDGKRQIPARAEAHSRVEVALSLLYAEAEGDLEQFKKNIEIWFDSSMERVSGWYKRYAQVVSVVLAVIVTVCANADSMVIVNALWTDPALRQSVVASAQRYVAENAPPSDRAGTVTEGIDPPPLPPDQQADVDFTDSSERLNAAMVDLQELQLPIGWKQPPSVSADQGLRLTTHDAKNDWPGPILGGKWSQAIRQHLFGWLLTIMAISLGAPFWFDTLNKFISIRSAGKAPEEKQKPPKQVPRPREPGEEA